MKTLMELYDGPCGQFKNPIILTTHDYWDGPLSGLCTVEPSNRIFTFNMLDTEEMGDGLYIPYQENHHGEPKEDYDKLLEYARKGELKEWDLLRVYQVFWIPDEIIEKDLRSTMIWEDASRCVWGTEIGTGTKEEADRQGQFQDNMKALDENEEQKQLKKDLKGNVHVDQYCCGWFHNYDIDNVRYWRRLKQIPDDYRKHVPILKDM